MHVPDVRRVKEKDMELIVPFQVFEGWEKRICSSLLMSISPSLYMDELKIWTCKTSFMYFLNFK